MKTKQLLEVALKIVAFIIIVPFLLDLAPLIQKNIKAYMSDTGPDISISPVLIIVQFAIVYFLLFRTEILVNLIYKEKPDEQELNININSFNAIFISIILLSLYLLLQLISGLIVGVLQFYNTNFFDDSEFSNMMESLLIGVGAQIVILVIVFLNARRITTWLESYRHKQVKPSDADTTTGADQ